MSAPPPSGLRNEGEKVCVCACACLRAKPASLNDRAKVNSSTGARSGFGKMAQPAPEDDTGALSTLLPGLVNSFGPQELKDLRIKS